MDLLAPRSLSVSASRRRSRRENDMPRYSSDTPERDDQGRFTSDNDRGSSRGRGGGDRDESERFASEGRSSRSRYDDDDSRSRGRDESGRFSSEGRSSRGRHDDDDNRSRGRDESGRFASERNRDDNDDRSRGRDDSGRFMSERNRRYDEDTRSRSRDDDRHSDRRSSSRGRDDDDRNEGRSRGWFGDSEGHSEASRRGWERSDHGGMATGRVTPKLRVVAGSVPTMARAAGLGTPKAIRTHLAGPGRTDIDPNAATTRMDAGVPAPVRMRVNPAAVPATTMIGAAKADGAGARRTMIVDYLRPDGAMAAGRATPRAMPRLRAVGGKPAVKS
jgi:hypothetical protein